MAQVSRYSTDLRQQISKIHLLAAVAAAAQKSHSAGRPFASRLGTFQGRQMTAPDSGVAVLQHGKAATRSCAVGRPDAHRS